MTQGDLAKAMGTNEFTVSHALSACTTAKQPRLTVFFVARMAASLQTTPARLLDPSPM